MGKSRTRAYPWFDLSLNLLPLVGVWLFGWRLFDVMFIYWFESAMILITGMMRVLWIGERPARNALGMLLYAPIYLGPAAGCVVGYGIVVIALFYGPAPIETWDQFPRMAELKMLLVEEWLWLPMAALFVTYCESFARNWIASGAYRAATVVRLLFSLYGRVILLQLLTVSVAAVLIQTRRGLLALAFLVAAKTAMDVTLYFWRTRREISSDAIMNPVPLTPHAVQKGESH